MTTLIWSPDAWARAAAVVSALAMAVALGSLIVAHCRPTGLSPWRSPVSQYGISSAAPLYRIQTLAMAISAVFLALGLGASVRRAGIATVLGALAAFAVARALISWSPTDPPATPVTSTGRRHGLLAILAFVAFGVGVDRLHQFQVLYHLLGWWSSATGVLAVVLWVTLVVMVLSRRVPVVRRYFGLVERVFYAGCIVFFFVSDWVIATSHP